MKIQNINNYMSYKSSSKAVKNEESVKAKKYDVIDIKSRTSENADAFIISIKNDVVSKINQETNTEKLNEIKNSIDAKTYSIDAEEIARRLLE